MTQEDVADIIFPISKKIRDILSLIESAISKENSKQEKEIEYLRGQLQAYQDVISQLDSLQRQICLEELINFNSLEPANFDIKINGQSVGKTITYKEYKSLILDKLDINAVSDSNRNIEIITNKCSYSLGASDTEYYPCKVVINGASLRKGNGVNLDASSSINEKLTLVTVFVEFNTSGELDSTYPADDDTIRDIKINEVEI